MTRPTQTLDGNWGLLKWFLLAFASRFVFLIRLIGRRPITILCPPPMVETNRGDQALYLAALGEIATTSLTDIKIVATGKERVSVPPWLPQRATTHNSIFYAFVSPRSFWEKLRWIWLLRSARQIVLIGADVLDEGYGMPRSAGSLACLYYAALAGVPSRIVSFSINEQPNDSLRHRLHRLSNRVQLFARDPVSFHRLASVHVEPLVLAADLAFLLPSAAISELTEVVQRFIKGANGKLLGVNIIRKVLGNDEAGTKRMRLFANSFCRLAVEAGYSILLIPHETPADVNDMIEFLGMCKEDCRDRFLLLDPLPSAAQIKRIAGECMHVFACRMHLAIATLGMMRPATTFPYQGKFEGLFEHLGIDNCMFPIHSLPDTEDAMYSLLSSQIDRTRAISEQLRNILPRIQQLSHLNFSGIQ